MQKNWPDNLEKYEKQQEILKSRNSYSKTDPDAAFFYAYERRSMGNGQLSTENQFIINYTLHLNPDILNPFASH